MEEVAIGANARGWGHARLLFDAVCSVYPDKWYDNLCKLIGMLRYNMYVNIVQLARMHIGVTCLVIASAAYYVKLVGKGNTLGLHSISLVASVCICT